MTWLKKYSFELLKFVITTAIAVAAVWIALLQYSINVQLENIDSFKLLTPSIGERFDPATWKLSLTNYGQSPLYIDSQMAAGAKFPMALKTTLFPGQSTEEDLHPFLAMYGLIPHQGSSTFVDYEIFFTIPNTSGPLYLGRVPIFLDNWSPQFQVKAPVPTVYVSPLKETNFQAIYQEINR